MPKLFKIANKDLKDSYDIEDLLSYQSFPFKMMGLLSFDFEKRIPPSLLSSYNVLKNIVGLLVILLPTAQLIFLIKTCYDERDADLLYLANLITSVFMLGGSACVLTHLFVKRDELQSLVAFINTRFKRRSEKGLEYVTITTAYRVTLYITIVWINLPAASVLFWSFGSVFSGTREFPVHSWYPFDAKQLYVFELICLIQIVTQLIMVTSYASISVLFLSMVIMSCSQLDILFCEAKNLWFTSAIHADYNSSLLRLYQRNKMNQDEEVNQYFCSTEIQEDFGHLEYDNEDTRDLGSPSFEITPSLRVGMRLAIKRIAQHHAMIMEFGKKLESLYNFLAFLRVGEMTLQLCFLAFVAVQAKQDFKAFFNNVQYIILTLIDLSLYAYPGEMLRQQSVKVGDALMRAQWSEISRYFKNDILIIQTCSLRPITLSGAKIFPLDISQLKMAVTTAFSYYTLLESIAARKD
ncbi:unnamed protein product [Hermetia illucens]|uniref:Odorant receptor n=1 Tax=Hermetia illucens TaxID=343691 RepID=A0A7R8V4I5_HERIL|nr:unnamed protein product [Hermetia illucens]